MRTTLIPLVTSVLSLLGSFCVGHPPAQSQRQFRNFEIAPGRLVFFYEETDQILKNETQFAPEGTAGKGDNLPSRVDVNQSPGKHYLKGHSPLSKDTGTDPGLKRQGQRCRGVCRYIPDRDFCTNDIPVEYDDYSLETSAEDYDEDDVGQSEPLSDRSPESEAYNSRDIQKSNEVEYGTEYLNITRAGGKSYFMSAAKPVELGKISKRNRILARRERRRRRPLSRLEAVRFRPAALEQEILIRWDRVVERGPYIGGDIILPEGAQLRAPNYQFQKKLWLKGRIPFEMDTKLSNCRLDAIFDAMDEIEDLTCIQFVERKKERDYLRIQYASIGCSSFVGRTGGMQIMNLSTGCFSKFTVTHELMHAIGFDHEQSRKDRDKFIEIDFNNVLRHKTGQFEINPSFGGSGFPYDIRSIMHYSAFLFGRNKCEPTIFPVNEKVDLCHLGLGNGRGGMTKCDAAKINKLYKCGRKYPKRCKL